MLALTSVEPSRIYSLHDICDTLGVTPATVRAWWREGMPHRPRRGTTRPYYTWGREILDFIREAFD